MIKIFNSTIAGIATPNAVGGISVIRISGEKAIETADKIFKSVSHKKLADLKGYTASYGKVYENGNALDDAVALVFRAPKSYTGEDVVEISCHGGIYITKKILGVILSAGAEPAAPGEFTKRAFLNGKMDLTGAEAVMDIISATGEQATKAARSVMDGSTFKKISVIKDSLMEVLGHLGAWIDYPEEDISQVEPENLLDTLNESLDRLNELISTYDRGKIIREGVKTVLVGKPNVGKSTLMNLLVGEEKSIVTDIAGTTRDVIEEHINIGGITLNLADTAGIRETDNTVEQIGVEYAKKHLKNAGLALAVFDSSKEFDSQDKELVDLLEGINTVAVINKTDLESKLDDSVIKEKFGSVVYISAKDSACYNELEKAILTALKLYNLDPGQGILANERQRHCAVKAHDYLQEAISCLEQGYTLDAVTVAVDTAAEQLLELTGETVTQATVDRVFSRFCVGK